MKLAIATFISITACVTLNLPFAGASESCPPGFKYDPSMKMCMETKAQSHKTGTCPEGEHPDPQMGGMCMPVGTGKYNLLMHASQYLIGISESGPRGRMAISSPDMFTVEFEKRISVCDQIKVTYMGSFDKWLTPSKGTPELLQVGEANLKGDPYIDAQHPHTSPVMGLTFAKVHCLGKDGKKTLTLFFAPRGEATAGPASYMHRLSSDGNPITPLGHHLEDVFHIMSTVLGAKLQTGKWTIEGSIFNGTEPSPADVNLTMGKFDSAGLRIQHQMSKNVTVGASVASVLESERIPGPNGPVFQTPHREMAVATWVVTQNEIKGGILDSTLMWGQATDQGKRLNAFLTEFAYTMQKNQVFGRVEVLQRSADQLQINVVGPSQDIQWIKSLTIGYNREIRKSTDYTLYAGGSVSQAFLPTAFKASYGGNPTTAEVHLRILFKKNKSWGTAPSDPGTEPGKEPGGTSEPGTAKRVGTEP